MNNKKYLEFLTEGINPQQMRRMTFSKIKYLNNQKLKKCPKTPNPAECNQKYNEKIAKLKERLKKQSGKILGVVPQTQKFVKKAEGMGND